MNAGALKKQLHFSENYAIILKNIESERSMKKTIKKFFAVILSLSLFCGLVGCDKSEQGVSPDASDSADNSEASDQTEPEQPKKLWINGTNTPWQHWNDFTEGMDEEFWDTEFARLVADGVNCTRIWLNCNGESIVRLTDDGKVRNINETHWEALDKLFDLADKHGIYIMPTLLSFDHFKEPVKSGQLFLTGHGTNPFTRPFPSDGK